MFLILIIKVGQNKFHLSHHFDKHNGVNMMGDQKPGVGGGEDGEMDNENLEETGYQRRKNDDDDEN